MEIIYLLLITEVGKTFWFTMQEDCNFTFHWVGRKWALLHYIVRLVFVLSPHPSERSESLKDEVLNFFPGSFQFIWRLLLLPGSCLTGLFLLLLRGWVVSRYDGHFRFSHLTKPNFFIQRQKRILLVWFVHLKPISMASKSKVSKDFTSKVS